MMVTHRSLGLAMVRAAMIPGIAQAKLESKGMKERPERPTPPINRSNKKAARGRYPDSSRIKMKKNKIKICGKNTNTPPAPAITPSTNRLLKMGGSMEGASASPHHWVADLMASMGA